MSERRADYAGVRWRVLGEASPALRHHTGRLYMRKRVRVRCVCGHEQVVFECDILAGRTHGCKSDKCRSAWQAVEGIRRKLRTWVRAPELRPMGDAVAVLDPVRDHVAEVMCAALDRWLLEQGEAHRNAVEEPDEGTPDAR